MIKSTTTKLAGSKGTTYTGLTAVLISAFLALIPQDVQSACIDAINATDSPVLTGGLLIGGVLLTIIGPSLANKTYLKPKEDTKDEKEEDGS